jgi:hypothetical protein
MNIFIRHSRHGQWAFGLRTGHYSPTAKVWQARPLCERGTADLSLFGEIQSERAFVGAPSLLPPRDTDKGEGLQWILLSRMALSFGFAEKK